VIKVIRISLILFCCWVEAGWAQNGLWASPTYSAAEPKVFTVEIEHKFSYHLYKPKNPTQKVRLLQKKYASMDTAEDAFVSRFSAVTSLNYPWWLDTWQARSREQAMAFFQQKGLDKAYWLDTWEKQFVGRKIKLKYKVLYQNYVIFTYNVSAPSGKEGFLDVPIVFDKQDKSWLVSLDLRQSPLLRYSPWVEGSEMEVIEYE